MRLVPDEMVNAPAPRSRYDPAGLAALQEAMAVVIVEDDVPAGTGTVMPAWALVQAGRVGGVHGFAVVSPSGRMAGSPACDQSMAREGQRRFAQGEEPLPSAQASACAATLPTVEIKNRIKKAAKRFLFISLKSQWSNCMACVATPKCCWQWHQFTLPPPMVYSPKVHCGYPEVHRRSRLFDQRRPIAAY